MLSRKVKGLIIGGFLLTMLFGTIGSVTADAQRRHRPRRVIVYRNYNPFWYRAYDPFYDPFYYSRRVVVDPIAYQREHGFSEGKGEGKDDAKKGLAPNATGHKDYLKSDSSIFREYFVQGYDTGYREEIAKIREKAAEKARDRGDE